MDFFKIKTEAKEVLKGNRLILFFFILAIDIIVGGLCVIGVGIVLLPLAEVGIFYVVKKLLQSNTLHFGLFKEAFDDLTQAVKVFAVGIAFFVFLAIGLALFIVPGILVACYYGMALFILAENKDLDIVGAFKKSSTLMNGHKWNFFVFNLSFIGHFLLFIITFGIYGIHFIPYYVTSLTNYYLHLTAQNEPEIVQITSEA